MPDPSQNMSTASTSSSRNTPSTAPSTAGDQGVDPDLRVFQTNFKNKETYLKNRLTQLENVLVPLEDDSAIVHDDDVNLLRKHLAAVDNAFEALNDLIVQTSILDVGNINKFMNDTNQYIPRIMTLRSSINVFRYPAQSFSTAPTINANSNDNSPVQVRVDNTFKPQLLDVNATPSMYHKWKKEFNVYLTRNSMLHASIDQQRMLLNNSLTSKMEQDLARLCLVEDDTSIEDILKELDNYFSESNNLITRRYEYFACSQKEGESIKDFIVRFRSIGDFAELDKLSYKDNMACKIIACIRNSALRKELLRLPQHDFASVYKYATAWESSNMNSDKVEEIGQGNGQSLQQASQSAEVNKLSTYKQGKKSQFRNQHNLNSNNQTKLNISKQSSQSSNQVSAPHNPNRQFKSPCSNCAQFHPPRACPAFGQSCTFCGIPGHFARACRKRKSQNFNATNNRQQQISEVDMQDDGTDNNQCLDPNVSAFNFDICFMQDYAIDNTPCFDPNISYVNTIARKTPKIEATFRFNDEILGHDLALPDTGASASILPLSCTQKWNLQVHPLSQHMMLKSVDGFHLQSLGTVDLDVQIEDSTVRVPFIVSPDIHTIILSWFALRDFYIIHERFPYPMPRPVQVNVDNIQGNQMQSLNQSFISKYPTVFSKSSKFASMKGDPMVIHLRSDINYRDIKPISKPRSIPVPLQKLAKKQIDQMVQQKIIRPIAQPTDFLSPLLVVPKKNGEVRLVVDYTQLNKYVHRPTHPFPSVHDVKALIPSDAKVFATLDAVKGYWQVPLHEESQPLTAFITPWGRYCYNRAPMGLSSSGDEFCRRADIAFSNIPNVIKMVDDILIYAANEQELVVIIDKVLTAARNNQITLSPDKFTIGREVSFVGLTISEHGITPDKRHLQAIADFPKPKNITDLRSFLGLINQFSSFSPNIAKYALRLRPLLSQDTKWMWDQSHQEAFQLLRQALTKPPVLQYFDPNRDTKLLTDASRLYGLGYVLMQRDHDNWGIISCGSRFLTSAETNYAVCELEALAITWAITKCRVFLLGLPHFEVFTDHRPLQTIFNSDTLDHNDNPRLLRLRQTVAMYRFQVHWTPGRLNRIPDALSRAPVDRSEVSLINQIQTPHPMTSDPSISKVISAAAEDDHYKDIRQAVVKYTKQEVKKLPVYTHAFMRQLLCVWDQLSVDPNSGLVVLNSHRIFVPQKLRRKVLEDIHVGHQGIARTRARMQTLYYWPGMNNDITQLIQACDSCQKYKESLPVQPISPSIEPDRPFQYTSCDLFEFGGYHYLVYVDRFSGWPLVAHFQKPPTSLQLITALKLFFKDFGIPTHLRHDGAKHLVSAEFSSFLKQFHITDELTSAYHPRSNGHAETTVKSIKALVKKCWGSKAINMDSFTSALLEYRNTPKLPGGLSPAEMIFGRTLRTLAPSLRYRTVTHKQIQDAKKLNFDMLIRKYSQFNSSLTSLPPLKIGDEVRLQNPITKIWDRTGQIVQVRDDHQSYVVESRSRQFLRNRKFLKLL